MASFTKSVEIDAPIRTVFGFHEREDALPLLTPPFPPVRLISKTPGIDAGTRVVLQVGPVRWVALHTAYEKNRLFVDTQVEGPFAHWEHRHEFEDLGERTRLTDTVEFRLPGGRILNVLFGWAARLGLRQMFAHRHAVTKRVCEETLTSSRPAS